MVFVERMQIRVLCEAESWQLKQGAKQRSISDFPRR
jgi:hypothetical protein